MLKPDKNYRMSKPLKMVLATFTDSHKRGQWKRMMIDAELCEKAARAAKLKEKIGRAHV